MKGIDVSYWQGPNVDFNKVKADGYDFVIIRAGYRTTKDKYWEDNYKKAKAAGLYVGAYWFQYAKSVDEAMAEAKAFIDALAGKQLEMPVYYDQEPDGDKTPPISKYEAFAYAFCQKVEIAGYFVGIYTSESFLKYYSDEFKNRFTLWVANWSSEPSTTKYPTMGIWQRTSKGNVGGINPVDMDKAYKDFPSIIKNAGLNGFTKASTIPQDDEECEACKIVFGDESQREAIVNQAKSWLGCKESDNSYWKIIQTYNNGKKTPGDRNYKMTKNDAWCACFVSACSIICGFQDIVFTEVSCYYMIELYKKHNRWQENDAYVPSPGDVIFYDWQDSGSGDNKGNPDHVGLVEKVSGNTITVIEGNISDSVGRRTIKVNGKNIRGFGIPNYKDAPVPTPSPEPEPEPEPEASVTIEVNQLKKGSSSNQVKAMQILLEGYGFNCGSYGADGDFGNDTLKALKNYQKDKGLDADGVCGSKTWSSLLGK